MASWMRWISGGTAQDGASTSDYRKPLFVASAGIALVAVGYLAVNRFVETFVPRDWHYRPGTLSAYLAKALIKHAKRRRRRRPIRVYMDGCFDMMHYGHANALRQARQCGDVLVVGVIPDREIVPVKGPPVNSEEERYTMVASVKWVDEILTDVPYNLTEEFLMELFTKHRIDYVVHGDDPCLLPDGTDAYAAAKRLGRFKVIRRTEGVSSTDIVGRMLMCSRDFTTLSERHDPSSLAHHFADGDPEDSGDEDAALQAAQANPANPEAPTASTLSHANSSRASSPVGMSPRVPPLAIGSVNAAARDSLSVSEDPGWALSRSRRTEMPPPLPPTRVAHFLPTTHRIVQFSDDRVPPPGARVVYIDGAWDVFHHGHVEVLRKARELGDFLLVGIHDDAEVRRRRHGAPHLPIMNIHERTLSVLACRYVDEVVIGAPEMITEDLLRTFNISLVVHGTVGESSSVIYGAAMGAVPRSIAFGGRYDLPKAAGIFQEIESPSDMTTAAIIKRIIDNRAAFETKYQKKSKGEAAYYANKKAVAEA